LKAGLQQLQPFRRLKSFGLEKLGGEEFKMGSNDVNEISWSCDARMKALCLAWSYIIARFPLLTDLNVTEPVGMFRTIAFLGPLDAPSFERHPVPLLRLECRRLVYLQDLDYLCSSLSELRDLSLSVRYQVASELGLRPLTLLTHLSALRLVSGDSRRSEPKFGKHSPDLFVFPPLPSVSQFDLSNYEPYDEDGPLDYALLRVRFPSLTALYPPPCIWSMAQATSFVSVFHDMTSLTTLAYPKCMQCAKEPDHDVLHGVFAAMQSIRNVPFHPRERPHADLHQLCFDRGGECYPSQQRRECVNHRIH
jgi:hypothetical protein